MPRKFAESFRQSPFQFPVKQHSVIVSAISRAETFPYGNSVFTEKIGIDPHGPVMRDPQAQIRVFFKLKPRLRFKKTFPVLPSGVESKGVRLKAQLVPGADETFHRLSGHGIFVIAEIRVGPEGTEGEKRLQRHGRPYAFNIFGKVFFRFIRNAKYSLNTLQAVSVPDRMMPQGVRRGGRIL